MASEDLPPALATKDELEGKFQSTVVDVVLENIRSDSFAASLPSYLNLYLDKLLHHSVTGGKLNRGLFVIQTAQVITWTKEKRELSSEEMDRAVALAWCVEVLQGSFLVADDIMDQSEKRRGRPCWYKNQSPLSDEVSNRNKVDEEDSVGLTAINDSLILESVVYILLEHHFGDSPALHFEYAKLFRKVTFQTELGQFFDLTSQPKKKSLDLNCFTMDLYHSIVLFKTSFYSFYLPVALGLMFTGESSPELLEEARSILLPLGEYFQIQDDYLDCYGDPAVTGKVGRDIEDKKCSWLMVQAVASASEEQKKILEKHYGVDRPQDVEIVKNVFRSLNLQQKFQKYEEESFVKINKKIADTSLVPKVLLNMFLKMIYKRKT